jgi:hypothetical protein
MMRNFVTEADHSPPSSAEDKNAWSYASTPPEVFMAWRLIKHRICLGNVAIIALGYGLDDRGSRVRFPAGAGNFSLHHRVQNGSGAHPVSYLIDTMGSFPGGRAAGA